LKFISIRTKFTIVVVLLSAVTTGLLGSYLVWKSYQALRLQAQQSELALAKSLAWQVNRGLSSAFQAVEALSRRPETSRMEGAALASELTLVTSDTELLDAMFVYQRPGHWVARSVLSLDPKNLPPDSFIRESVARANELRESVLVKVYQTPSRNWGVGISAPIFDGNRLKGILAGVLYLPNHTIGNLETAEIGKSGFAYLIDDQGEALIRPDENRIQGGTPNPAVLALRPQKEGVVLFQDGQGKKIMAAYASVPSANWGVVVRQSADECYAPAEHMLRFMSFFLGLTLLMSVILALALSQRIVEPLLRLTQQVGNYSFESGNIPAMESVKPVDEIGVLSLAIGSMTRKIKFQSQERERAHAKALQVERKLSESEKLATVGQLAAGLAHELNNPLTVILGLSQLAKKSKGIQLREWLETIKKESERCQRLVRDLLYFTRPIRLRRKKTDLVLLIHHTWKQLLLNRTAFYELKLNADSFQVFIDPDRFKQVFINILSNAMDAMPGGGRVEIGFHKNRGQIRVQVRDQGRGFARKNLEKFFRPFFTTKSGGTGLGLAIARAILQSHGGRIWAERNKLHGAVFQLQWPDR
jgi:signal transduction histidine kinase